MSPAPATPSDGRFTLRGWIGSAGFASGDRFVVGHWARSPVGPITDVMWARPDGTRVLLAPHRRAADFITAVYAFDEVEVTPIAGQVGPTGLRVRTDRLALDLVPRRWFLPLPGALLPAALWRWVAAPIAKLAMDVRVHGHSPTGVEEWYRARRWSPLRDARGELDGRDLGALASVDPPLGVGFSEPPSLPSLTRVDPLLRDCDGRVAAAVA